MLFLIWVIAASVSMARRPSLATRATAVPAGA
jgi:hypothetical protein